MELLRPVFWGQGMFLHPQHFQQQDCYHDAKLRRSCHLFIPFCWGVKSLVINEPALQNFQFEIEQFEVVTWDGSILRFRGDLPLSNTRLAPRSFENFLDKTGKPLHVYLGLKRMQLEERLVATTGANGAALREEGNHRRFIVEERETPDAWAEEDHTTQLQYLVHDVQLLFDVSASRTQDYELLKIAEVVRASDGKGGVLSRSYIPPCITIQSSSELRRLCAEARDLLTAKGNEFAQYQQRQSAEMGAPDLSFQLMRQAVNRYIPMFHHYLELEEIHPVHMYTLLRQAVGELSTFSETVSVLGARAGEEGLPPYNHDQLWPCFSLATQRLKELLNEMTESPVGDVVLTYDGKEYFTADLDAQFFAGDNRYYFAIRSDLSPNELFRLLQKTGKITARQEMPGIRNSFLFGLKIDVLENPPEELRLRAHYRYFQVDQRPLVDHNADHWLKIKRAGNMAVYCPELPPHTEIRFLVVYGGRRPVQ